MKLTDSITDLKGIGPRKAEAFGKLGLFSMHDVLYHFPRKYRDYSKTSCIMGAKHGDYVALELKLKSDPKLARVRRGLDITTARAFDQSGEITLAWYNQPYRMKAVVAGECVYACGRVDRMHGVKMINPSIYRELPGILPVYPVCAGLSQKLLRDTVKAVLEGCSEGIEESLPASMRQKYGLIGLYDALRGLHFPGNMEEIKAARQRLAFEDTLMFSLTLSMMQYSLPKREQPLKLEGTMSSFIKLLPFEPTNAQLKAMEEIRRNLAGERLMNRLLQGDVGSGKTAVALYAMYAAMKNGKQAALMAPTEILAAQHYTTLCKIFGAGNVAYLKGGMKKAEREAELARIADGTAKAITGTHALLHGDVEFHDLGMVITDEQHRFGVKQREALERKGNNPDLLVTTATPIPRSLALTVYGDLSLTVIDEMPKNRQKIQTMWINSPRLQAMYGFVREELERGRQAFIVCPLVEESEKIDLENAMSLAAQLQEEVFRKWQVGLLHGRMKAAAKREVMERFRAGEIDVLVSTTVIEVGVDVPNATVMIVEDADKFGLSQLHQLRGRVGRGEKPGFMCLISATGDKAACERLSAMEKTEDGFKLAEYDLSLRREGDILGNRQHGASVLKLVNVVRDGAVIEAAHADAREYMETQVRANTLESKLYLREVDAVFSAEAQRKTHTAKKGGVR